MIAGAYRAQVDLLLQVLPFVAEESVFALKGGTAINLFIRNMPRLSVDIDLTYLPFDDRTTALNNISAGLKRIKEKIERTTPAIKVMPATQDDGQEVKLLCQTQNAQIKIEVNTIIRGQLLQTRQMDVSDVVEKEFNKFASANVVSHAELFGGKICAALDRQHPRDLFDIHYMFENGGISDEIRLGFIALLLSHSRPIHELVRPNFQDQRDVFQRQFAGMALTPFTYSDFENARERLVQEIHTKLTDDDRAFLISFKKGNPDWRLFSLASLQNMPAVKWKLMNIQNLIKQNSEKHREQVRLLEKKLMEK